MLLPCLNKVEMKKQCLKDVTEEMTGLVALLCLKTELLHKLQCVGEGR